MFDKYRKWAASGSTAKTTIKAVALAMCALLIFGLGINIGNGTIVFGKQGTVNGQLPDDLDYASVERLYDTLRQSYDGELSEQKLLDGIKSGLVKATGDPYTEYFNAADATEFQEQLTGSFTGIGAELGKDADDNLIVVSPIEGFPAAKAGLRAQDIIASIDDTSTTGMSIDDAVKRIRGEAGTDVTLKLIRGKTEAVTLKITRAVIKIPSVKWQVTDENIGYLQITQFSNDTSELTEKAAKEFKSKGVKGVVLDVRNDPGGLLDSAVDVASLWVPRGKTILQEKRGNVVTRTYKATGNDILNGVPTVVLINAGSASASEIVAGALKDNKAATLYGEKSYGKGSVQQIQDLPYGAEVKITMARWYRPNGQNIDKKGIAPDTEVKMTEDDYTNKRDPQKDAAIQFLQR